MQLDGTVAAYRNIYELGFPEDSKEQIDFFFEKVCRPEDIMLGYNEIHEAVAGLYLRHFDLNLNGTNARASYIHAAATLPTERSKGHMSRLIENTLKKSAQMGDDFCILIPAREPLFNFYTRFGFRGNKSMVVRPSRNSTSLTPVYGLSDDELWLAFDKFQRCRTNTLLHDKMDFLLIMQSFRLDNNLFVAMGDDKGNIQSMAWGFYSQDNSEIYVVEALGTSQLFINDAINHFTTLSESALVSYCPEHYMYKTLNPRFPEILPTPPQVGLVIL